MKLPPLALVAPSLCPRCDQPAMVVMDHSRYCGFCGHELVRGLDRPIWWRLWLLAALVPLAAALTGGIWWASTHPIK